MADLRGIDLNLLVTLDALLDEQNVTRAAERLALTQPTVSAMLARLRKLFGDPLLVRSQHGMLPTPRAEALAPVLKEWLAHAHTLVAGSVLEPATTAWSASIAANDYVQSTLLVPFIEQLRRTAPNVHLTLRSAEFCKSNLTCARNDIDLCLATDAELPALELRSRVLYRERYVCVVRACHPLARRSFTLDQFCRYPHVRVSSADGHSDELIDRTLAQAGRKRVVVLSVPGFLVLPKVLAADDLIAVVPERALRDQMKGLAVFAPPLPMAGFSVTALWHQRLHAHPPHRWLRNLLVATAGDLDVAPARARYAHIEAPNS